jgi:hypothetical protein
MGGAFGPGASALAALVANVIAPATTTLRTAVRRTDAISQNERSAPSTTGSVTNRSFRRPKGELVKRHPF